MNPQLREAVLSGQVSAAQVVQHQLAGELPIQMLDDAQDPPPPDCWDRCAKFLRNMSVVIALIAGAFAALCFAKGMGLLS